MKKSLRIAALVATLVPIAAHPLHKARAEADASGRALDLHAALVMALAQSPTNDSAQATARSAGLAADNAWRAFLPTLDAQAGHAYDESTGGIVSTLPQPPTHAPFSNYLGLSLGETLYDNGTSWRAAETATLTAQAARLTAQQARLQTLLTAAKAFYDFSMAAASAELQRAQLAALRKQFLSIEGRYRQGTTSNRDFIRIKTEVERGEIAQSAQQISIEEARKTLRLAIGAREAADFLPYAPDDSALDSLTIPATSAESTFEYRIAAAQDRASQITVRSAERDALPRLTLAGSYRWNQPQYLGGRDPYLDQAGTDLQATLTLDWSIWDWGIRGRKIEIAKAQSRIDKDARDVTRLQATHDLTRLSANARTLLRERLQSRQVLRDVEAAFGAVASAYRDGKAAYLDLSVALSDLFSSRTQHIQIQFDLLKARADLGYYQGDLDEILGVR